MRCVNTQQVAPERMVVADERSRGGARMELWQRADDPARLTLYDDWNNEISYSILQLMADAFKFPMEPGETEVNRRSYARNAARASCAAARVCGGGLCVCVCEGEKGGRK